MAWVRRGNSAETTGDGDAGGFAVEVAWDSTTPARPRFIPGKTRENRHLLRYPFSPFLSLFCSLTLSVSFPLYLSLLLALSLFLSRRALD